MEGENAPLYCICRKPDINCFMMYDHLANPVVSTIAAYGCDNDRHCFLHLFLSLTVAVINVMSGSMATASTSLKRLQRQSGNGIA